MKLRELMTPDVKTVRPDQTLQEAASRMKDVDVGLIPVCDGQRLLGVVTDRDLALRAVAAGLDPKTTRVEEVMTREVRWCYEDDDVTRAAELMQTIQIRRLPVIDRNKDLVGIVSLGDLAVDAGAKLAGKTLEGVSRPSEPR